MYAAAAASGERLAWEPRSGSLKDMRWVEPEAIALVAAEIQLFVWVEAVPQRRGTNSNAEGMDAVEEPQL